MNTERAQPKAEHLDFPRHFHPRATHSSAAQDQDLHQFTAENGASSRSPPAGIGDGWGFWFLGQWIRFAQSRGTLCARLPQKSRP